MDQFQQKRFKIGEGRGASLGGGVITERDPPLLPFGAFSIMNNVEKDHPGIKKRRGMIKLHSAVAPGVLIESTPVFDGEMQVISGTWAGARNAANGSGLNTTGPGLIIEAFETSPGGTTLLHRSWMDFENIVLPPTSIISATLTLWSNSILVKAADVTIVQSSKAAFGALVTSDWQGITTTLLGTPTAMNNGIEGTPFVMPINAAGITYLDTTVRSTGKAEFAVLSDHDALNNPTGGAEDEFIFRSSNYSNPLQHPLLSIQMAA